MMIIDGAVLAGGRSSRMGQDKALLARDHRDMFFYTADLLEQLPLQQKFVSRNPHQVSYLTRWPVVADTLPNQGPLGGIQAVAERSEGDAILVVPIDLPLLESRDLNQLIALGRLHHRPVHFLDHYLPLFLPLTPEVRDYLNDVVSGKIRQRSVKALCQHFDAIALNPDNEERLCNTNTPEQWQAAKQLIAQI